METSHVKASDSQAGHSQAPFPRPGPQLPTPVSHQKDLIHTPAPTEWAESLSVLRWTIRAQRWLGDRGQPGRAQRSEQPASPRVSPAPPGHPSLLQESALAWADGLASGSPIWWTLPVALVGPGGGAKSSEEPAHPQGASPPAVGTGRAVPRGPPTTWPRRLSDGQRHRWSTLGTAGSWL